jgi:uncharacterized protein YcgI (DUF1989 family)
MSYVVVLWRIGVEGTDVAYHDVIVGPFRSEERAEEVAARISRRAAKCGDDVTVTVRPIAPAGIAAIDALEWFSETAG